MLGLYILGGIISYLGVGVKCAQAEIKNSVEENKGEVRAAKHAIATLYFWPIWVIDDLPTIVFRRRYKKELEKKNLLEQQDKEVERLLAEENI